MTIDRILELLAERAAPMTCKQMASELKLTFETVNQAIRRHRRAHPGEVRVADFCMTDGPNIARMFALGSEPDAEWDSTRRQIYDREMKRAARRAVFFGIADGRDAQDALAKIKPFRDEALWALFGGGS